MRTKTRGGGRARLPKFPSSPSSATLALPSLDHGLDEANGVSSIGRIAPGSSSKNNDDVDVIASAYNDDETDIRTVSDSGLGLMEECMDMDWSEGETCLRCDRGGGSVLVCSQSGCPIALHERCMSSGPKFDDVGNFYCPYCWYKHEVVRAKELRMKAIKVKKSLACFIDLERVGGEKEKEDDGRADKAKELNMPSLGGEKNYGDCEDTMDANQVDDRSVEVGENLENNRENAKLGDSCGQFEMALQHQSDPLTSLSHCGDNIIHIQEKTPGVESLKNSTSKEGTCEENVSKTHESGIMEDGQTIQVEDPGQVDDGGHERIADENQLHEEPQSAFCVEEENVVDGSLNLSKEDSHSTVKLKHGRWEEEEKMDPKTSETKVSDSDKETIVMRQWRVTRNSKKAQSQNVDSPRKSSSSVGATRQKICRARNEKVTASRKPTQQSSAGTFTTLTFGNEKRKRLHWTAEEEEMLKEGVQKFSTKVNKNLPWRKVLEFGRHVFDPTRTPSDLKDKWRNIMAKESTSINRR